MPVDIAKYSNKIRDGKELLSDEVKGVFDVIANGDANPMQVSFFLGALSDDKITPAVLYGAILALRDKMVKFEVPEGIIHDDIMDCCGTGGTGLHTLNISTAVAFVLAGAGVPVVKHGNKAVSSKSGSADVLTALGINIDVEKEVMQQALKEANVCFLMAPKYHPAMRHVGPIRAELKARTIFNLIGPLLNPAAPKRQLIGVYDPKWLTIFAETLKLMGAEGAAIVHGAGGIDEMSITGESQICMLDHEGNLHEFSGSPESNGLPPVTDMNVLKGGNPDYNAKRMRDMFAGEYTPYRDAVVLNAMMALMVNGTELDKAKKLAEESIFSGKALAALDKLAEVTSSAP